MPPLASSRMLVRLSHIICMKSDFLLFTQLGKRALASIPPWDPIRQDEDAIESMKMIWQTHMAILSVQSNDKRMFREISRGLRGMDTPQLFIEEIGPPAWYEEHEAMKREQRGWFR